MRHKEKLIRWMKLSGVDIRSGKLSGGYWFQRDQLKSAPIGWREPKQLTTMMRVAKEFSDQIGILPP